MKTAKLSDIRKRNAQRRPHALRAARCVNPDFVPGMRTSDRPRKNPHKQRILEEMQEKEDELQRR
ncbi:hypothetical protein [Salinicoccus sp. HZC-1]|uniref:hypothetical protein n=1 Tax=Salinicoccus sp. HZC-1 TaxID=3385497 RepID=UPI00398AAFC0